jgi:sec-independent protein translocase protein TatC
MSDDAQEMGFWQHFDVLRSVLLKVGLVIAGLAVAFFVFMPEIFDGVILAPCRSDFPLYALFDAIDGSAATGDFHVDLVNYQLASQMFTHLSTSFYLALVFGFPVVIYLLWGFVKPGLYERERRHAVRAFVAGNVMFYLGVGVGYFLVFPLTLRFLATYQLSTMIPNTISLDSYMDNFLMIVLVMGVVFELPLLAWLLGRMGLLRRSFFARYRRHAIVALLIAAALITPTGDPVTLFVVFIPLYALWEMSSRLVPAVK